MIFILHVAEFILFGRYKDHDVMKVASNNRTDLSDDDKYEAWKGYWCLWLGRGLISSAIYLYVARYQTCQPFLGACFCQDYFITMTRQIW